MATTRSTLSGGGGGAENCTTVAANLAASEQRSPLYDDYLKQKKRFFTDEASSWTFSYVPTVSRSSRRRRRRRSKSSSGSTTAASTSHPSNTVKHKSAGHPTPKHIKPRAAPTISATFSATDPTYEKSLSVVTSDDSASIDSTKNAAGDDESWDLNSRFLKATRAARNALPDYILAKHPDFSGSRPSPFLMYYFDETAPNPVLLSNDVKDDHPIGAAGKQLRKMINCEQGREKVYGVDGEFYGSSEDGSYSETDECLTALEVASAYYTESAFTSVSLKSSRIRNSRKNRPAGCCGVRHRSSSSQSRASKRAHKKRSHRAPLHLPPPQSMPQVSATVAMPPAPPAPLAVVAARTIGQPEGAQPTLPFLGSKNPADIYSVSASPRKIIQKFSTFHKRVSHIDYNPPAQLAKKYHHPNYEKAIQIETERQQRFINAPPTLPKRQRTYSTSSSSSSSSYESDSFTESTASVSTNRTCSHCGGTGVKDLNEKPPSFHSRNISMSQVSSILSPRVSELKPRRRRNLCCCDERDEKPANQLPALRSREAVFPEKHPIESAVFEASLSSTRKKGHSSTASDTYSTTALTESSVGQRSRSPWKPQFEQSPKTERERDYGYHLRKHFFDVEKAKIPQGGTDLQMLPQYSVSYKNYPRICYDVVVPTSRKDFYRIRKSPGFIAP